MDTEVSWIFLLTATLTFLHVFIDIVSNRKPFKLVLNNKGTWIDKLIVITLFGGFSILGTYMGTELPSGAILNYRDLGPMIAGLAGGPVVGLVSGLIGGIHRFTMDGFTTIPCGLATILIGLTCGLIKQWNGNKLISLPRAVSAAILMECFHFALVLLIARPFDDALKTVQIVALPMIISNAAGMIIALLLITKDKGEPVQEKNINAN
jgi:phosphoserine phosphatase RsbU/P